MKIFKMILLFMLPFIIFAFSADLLIPSAQTLQQAVKSAKESQEHEEHEEESMLDKVANDGHEHVADDPVNQYFASIWRLKETNSELQTQSVKVFVFFVLLMGYRLVNPGKLLRKKGPLKNV